MKSFLHNSIILLILLFNLENSHAQTTYYQVSVYFKTGVTRIVSPGDTAASVTAQDILNVLAKYGLPASNVYPAFPAFVETDTLKVIDKLGDSLKQMDKAKVFVITVPDTTTQNNLTADLKNLNEVLFAEQNGSSIPYIVPHDPGFGNQWGLNNSSNPGHDIHAEAAWDIFTGNPSSIIGIIDYGVDVTHPDLSAKIAGGDRTYSLDGTFSHGTLVAGIAGASTNNNVGMAGVDWQAQLLPQDMTDYNNCTCISYFKNEHGDVQTNTKIYNAVNFSPNVWTLNHSYGLTFNNKKDGRYSVVVRDGFAYAYKNNRTSVAAVGNALQGTTTFPAGFNTGLIGVGESDQNDLPYGSTVGPFVDVMAPGFNIYSTDHNNQYIYQQGSSLSAPFVSGLASLLKGYNTSLFNDDIEQIIDLSADYYGSTPPYDQAFGFGRINAQKALQFLESPYQIQHLAITGGSIYATSGNMKMVMLGVLGLSDALYTVQRVEVRTTITLPTECKIVGVWGTGLGTNGFRDDGGYCFGEGFCQVVPGSVSSTNATLRTYIYYVTDVLGHVIGYFPRTPQNVKFTYTILGIPAPVINGDNMVCTTSNPYTLSSLPSGATVSWSATPSSPVQINTPNANSTTLTKVSSSLVTLNALVTNGCGVGQNYNATRIVQIGGPYVGINYSPNGSCVGSMQVWQLAASPASGTNWHWSVGYVGTNGSIYILSPLSQQTFADVVGGGIINLNYTDLCGVAQQQGVTVYSSCHSQAVIAPNPASGMVTISTMTTGTTNQAQTDAISTASMPWKIYQMKLIGPSGNLVGLYKYPVGITSTNIDVSSLPNGTYTLQFFDNTTWSTQQILVLR